MPTFKDFTPCKEVPPTKLGRYSAAAAASAATIREFLRSGTECARYECKDAREAKSYGYSLRSAAADQPVTVSLRGRCVYLSRKGARDGR